MKIIISEKQLGLLKKDEKSSDKNDVVLFIAGLDDRYSPSYDTFQEQDSKIKTGLGNYSEIKSFPWDVSDSSVLKFLERNPNPLVFLFSKGCEKIYLFLSNPNVNLSKVFLIEPWAVGKSKKTYINAISSGLPSKNIFVGPNEGRGFGIPGASSSNSKGHFQSIINVSSLFRK